MSALVRDPRTDPRPGDVLVRKRAGKTIEWTVRKLIPGEHGPDSALIRARTSSFWCDTWRAETLGFWRHLMATAEVIRRAEDSEAAR